MTTTWLAAFRSAVLSPYEQIQLTPARGFADETVRQVLTMNGGGDRLRVSLSNRYGRRPLTIGSARLALRKCGTGIVAETDTALRFEGAERVVLAPGAEITSDTVDLAVSAGDDVMLSLYLPGESEPATFAHRPTEFGYITSGDHTADADLPDAEETRSRFYVTGIDVLGAAGTPVVVAFGDSWLQGSGTTVGANRRSADVLNARLTRGWVVNQAIAGNRLLTDEVGDAGLSRFDRDVLGVPGVTEVVTNFGINDLGLGGTAPAADLIAGYIELAGRAHAAGLRVYATTIGPFAGVIYPGVEVDNALPVRREVNEWLRRTEVFDAVFDVAAAVADPERPDYIRADLDSGDGMHLNDEGARIMGECLRIPSAR